MLLAIDPGREKCGLALFDDQGKLLNKQVLPRPELQIYLKKQSATRLVIGQGAFGQALAKEIKEYLPTVVINFVAETNSTQQARLRYWQANKPRGLWRLIPTSLRQPPVLIDDYAAVILGERYLHH